MNIFYERVALLRHMPDNASQATGRDRVYKTRLFEVGRVKAFTAPLGESASQANPRKRITVRTYRCSRPPLTRHGSYPNRFTLSDLASESVRQKGQHTKKLYDKKDT